MSNVSAPSLAYLPPQQSSLYLGAIKRVGPRLETDLLVARNVLGHLNAKQELARQHCDLIDKTIGQLNHLDRDNESVYVDRRDKYIHFSKSKDPFKRYPNKELDAINANLTGGEQIKAGQAIRVIELRKLLIKASSGAEKSLSDINREARIAKRNWTDAAKKCRALITSDFKTPTAERSQSQHDDLISLVRSKTSYPLQSTSTKPEEKYRTLSIIKRDLNKLEEEHDKTFSLRIETICVYNQMANKETNPLYLRMKNGRVKLSHRRGLWAVLGIPGKEYAKAANVFGNMFGKHSVPGPGQPVNKDYLLKVVEKKVADMTKLLAEFDNRITAAKAELRLQN
ncbi:hypothetical protein ACIPL1_25200 [Pseudomonas sp. NPDC090202]|uniref:hypothetical protein n=1 Tax=unclassified Pseudomonas TaxID=196821 RepID=UPI00382DCE97